MTGYVLETERLRLRYLQEEDLPVLAAMLQHPEVMAAWERTFDDSEVRAWLERAQQRYAQSGCGHYLAELKATGEPVGQIGLIREELTGCPQLGVGWMLRREHWGRGYATEGGAGCLDYAFRKLGAARVIADIRPENRGSIRVAGRLGMEPGPVIDKTVGARVMPHRIYVRRTPLVTVCDYDPRWPEWFGALARVYAPLAAGFGGCFEQVGSTAVPGLAAKPVIDCDLVLPDWSRFDEVRRCLEARGLVHRGDLGLAGREMFSEDLHFPFRHNLYVCREGSPALKNHRLLRDYLRGKPEAARRYGRLKRALAERFPEDVDAYGAGKSDLIFELLRAAGMTAAEAETIRELNQLPGQRGSRAEG